MTDSSRGQDGHAFALLWLLCAAGVASAQPATPQPPEAAASAPGAQSITVTVTGIGQKATATKQDAEPMRPVIGKVHERWLPMAQGEPAPHADTALH
jgi:hypothetical protein